MSEDQACIQSEKALEKVLLDSGAKRVREKYSEKQKGIQSQLESLKAELSSIEARLVQ